MNKFKKLTALVCALAVLCIATFALTRYEEEQESIKNSDEIVLQVDPAQVQTFAWEYGEESLSFHRDEGGIWRWDEDDAFPVDEEIMQGYLETFREFGAAFVIEDVTDYSQYGLTQPECTIRLTTGDSEYTVKLGTFSKMDSQRYVSTGDGNAYLVGTDPLEDFQVTIRDMIDNDEIPQFDQVTKITFAGLAGYTIHYEEESTKSICAEDVYFTGNLPLDTGRVEDYLEELTGLSLTNYVTYSAGEEDLTAFGLKDAALTVTVESPEESLTLFVSPGPEAEEEEEQKGYVRIGDSPIVYEISQELYETLTKVAYNDLRHTELMPADFADITQADITLESMTYCFTTQEEDGEILWYYDGEEMDAGSFESAVFNLFADGFTEEKPTGEEEISITFHLKNENIPTVTIALYRYDGSDCLATVDGEPTALIDRVYAVDLIEAVLAIVL